MRISDEIRELAGEAGIYSNACGKLHELADRIDREMVELPKDADGEVIHVGDALYRGAEDMHVESLRFNGQWEIRNSLGYIMSCGNVHTSPDSWERIADDLEDWSKDNRTNGIGEVFGKAAYFADRIRKLAKEDE